MLFFKTKGSDHILESYNLILCIHCHYYQSSKKNYDLKVVSQLFCLEGHPILKNARTYCDS